MSRPSIRIHDLATGNILDREMTAAELTEHEADQAALQDKENAEKSKVAAKAALLERLGLTADEAALLLG
jgi:hypothetical protein